MKTKKPRIVITGGHLTPALALIEKLQQENWEIIFFGRKQAIQGDRSIALEAKIIPQKKIKFIPLYTGRFRRHIDFENIIDLSKIFIGIFHATLLLFLEKPNIVVSFGGYLGLPTIIAAWFLRIPSVIHEQISVAGLANKLSAPFTTKIALAFPTSTKYYNSKKTIVTGNPVQTSTYKKNIQTIRKYTKNFNKNKTIYVTGGNLGSKIINKTIIESLPNLLKRYNIIHQIGTINAQLPEWKTAQEFKNTSNNKTATNYYPIKFIKYTEIGSIFSCADLVISRGGANTVYDLGSLNKPSIIIPLEPSLMDEQLHNALLLKKSGLATLLHEEELNSNNLIKEIDNKFNRIDKIRIKPTYKKVFHQKGAENLYNLIEKISNKS